MRVVPLASRTTSLENDALTNNKPEANTTVWGLGTTPIGNDYA